MSITAQYTIQALPDYKINKKKDKESLSQKILKIGEDFGFKNTLNLLSAYVETQGINSHDYVSNLDLTKVANEKIEGHDYEFNLTIIESFNANKLNMISGKKPRHIASFKNTIKHDSDWIWSEFRSNIVEPELYTQHVDDNDVQILFSEINRMYGVLSEKRHTTNDNLIDDYDLGFVPADNNHWDAVKQELNNRLDYSLMFSETVKCQNKSLNSCDAFIMRQALTHGDASKTFKAFMNYKEEENMADGEPYWQIYMISDDFISDNPGYLEMYPDAMKTIELDLVYKTYDDAMVRMRDNGLGCDEDSLNLEASLQLKP